MMVTVCLMERKDQVKTMGQAKRTNTDRRFTGGGPRPDHRKIQQEEGAERLKHWTGLSPQAQLDALDSRLGKGVGAAKQRARILAKIEDTKNPRKPSDIKKAVEAAGAPTAPVASAEPEKRMRAKERRERSQQKRPGK